MMNFRTTVTLTSARTETSNNQKGESVNKYEYRFATKSLGMYGNPESTYVSITTGNPLDIPLGKEFNMELVETL